MAQTVGLVVHAGRAEARRAAVAAAEDLRELGAKAVACAADAWPGDELTSRDVQLRSPEEFADGLDVVLVLGGDGTFLRAAWMARDGGVPLLGVDLGRLGFLSEVESTGVRAAIDRLLAGRFDVEERMTLSTSVHDADGACVADGWALNEASVERTVPQRLIVLRLEVAGTVLTDIPADAVVCATPTGSTAYAFSAGGPVLTPSLSAMVVVPVAPHTLFDRTVVVSPSETVRVTPIGGNNVCVVTLDGRESLRVPDGGWVTVCAGDVPVRLVRLGAFDFYARLRDKFRL